MSIPVEVIVSSFETLLLVDVPGLLWILGSPFLRAYITTFDRGKEDVSYLPTGACC